MDVNLMTNREVIFYKRTDGRCPVEEFLDRLASKDAGRRNPTGGNIQERLFSKPTERVMSDLKTYVQKRKASDKAFALNYEKGYEEFKIGEILRQAREKVGLTQEELAERVGTQKTAISRIENHAEDIKLSTLEKVAAALGKKIRIAIS